MTMIESFSFCFNGHFFRGKPGLAGFIEAKDDGSGGDNWSYKFQSNRHQQQTNTQCFTGRMPFLSPNQQCQSTKKGILVTQLQTHK